MRCMVISCGSNPRSTKEGSETISFHKFPRNYLCQAWVKATGRKHWAPKKHHYICSRHFPDEVINVLGGKRILLPTAVPTLFLWDPQVPYPQDSDDETQYSPRLMNDGGEIKVFKRSKSMESDLESQRDARILNDGSEDKVAEQNKIMEHQDNDGWLVLIAEDKLKSNRNNRPITRGNKIMQTDPLSTTKGPPSKVPCQECHRTKKEYEEMLRKQSKKVPCQECVQTKKEYEEKFRKQTVDMHNQSTEIATLKRKLEKANADLKTVRTKVRTKQKMIYRLKQRYLNLIRDDSDDNNDPVDNKPDDYNDLNNCNDSNDHNKSKNDNDANDSNNLNDLNDLNDCDNYNDLNEYDESSHCNDSDDVMRFEVRVVNNQLCLTNIL